MFRKKFTFLLLVSICLCFPFTGIASHASDSLRRLIAHTPDKTIKAIALGALAREIRSSHPDSAFIYARQSRELSASIGFQPGISRALNIIGVLFLDIGNETKAMEYFLQSLRICEQSKDKRGLARCYNNIGFVFNNQKMNDKALAYYLKSLHMEEALNNKLGIAQSLNNISLLYNDIGEYPQAISFSLRSLELYKQLGINTGLAEILNTLGLTYKNQRKFTKALDYYQQSLKIREQIYDKPGIAVTAYNIAMIYQSLGNIPASSRINDRALKIAYSLGNSDLVSKCAIIKSQNLAKTGDYKPALRYLELSRSINDSLANVGMDRKIQEMEQAYEMEKQQSQIVLLEKDNIIQQKLAERQRLQRNLMIGGFLVVALFAFFIFQYGRRIKKINRLLAQRNLEILRHQEDLDASHLEISRQRDVLKQNNADKDKFFSIVAHDLKSPFTSMLGFSEILAEDFGDLSEAERHEIAIDIHSAIKTGFNLLENLLSWGSLQIGKIEFAPNQLNLRKEVDEVMKLLQRIALHKRIGIYNDVEPHLTVDADANMLHAVLRNLVSNALKYTNQGGKIRISAAVSEITGMIQVAVNDSGIGMSQDNIAKLFSPAINFSTRGTANETGTGLGLLLCSEMIAKHGGKISAQSEQGRGSTFFFTLPEARKHEVNI
jgi:two-component system, sensor histidine kinase and response regulator